MHPKVFRLIPVKILEKSNITREQVIQRASLKDGEQFKDQLVQRRILETKAIFEGLLS